MFDEPLLPAVIRMAEENADTEHGGKSMMIFEENIIVRGARLHLGKALLDTKKSLLEISHRNRQNLLDEGDAKLSVNNRE